MSDDKNNYFKNLIKPIIGKLKSRKVNIINTTAQEVNNSNSNNNNNSILEKNTNTPKKLNTEREIEKEKLYFSIVTKNNDCESKNPLILSDIFQNDLSIEKNLMLLSNKLMSHRIEVVKDKGNKEDQILYNIFISLSRESLSMLDEKYSENLNKMRSKIFNFIGVDSNNLNSNRKINNSILNYFISNILDIKNSYKEKNNINEEENENCKDYVSNYETFEEEYKTIDNKFKFESSIYQINSFNEFSITQTESFELERSLINKEKERNAHNKDLSTILSFFNSIKNDSSLNKEVSKEEPNEEYINKNSNEKEKNEEYFGNKKNFDLQNPFLHSLSNNFNDKRKEKKSLSILENFISNVTYTNSGFKNLKRHSIIDNY